MLDEALAPLPVPEARPRARGQLAVRPGVEAGRRPLVSAARLHAEGRRLAAVLGRHVRQPWRTAREPGDLVILWTRRSRALAADSWTAPEVPLAEEREAYEVEVLDGATVLRTLTAATTSVTYTAARADSPTSGRSLGLGRRARRSASTSSPPSSGGALRQSVTLQF